MFIGKNKFNKWQLSNKCKDMQGNDLKDNAGNNVYCNMNVVFKKGSEPKQEDLNKYGVYEITKLLAYDSNNRVRPAYLLPNAYTNTQGVMVKEYRLVLGDWQFNDEQSHLLMRREVKTEDNLKEIFGGNVKVDDEPINSDNLPFY